MSTRTEWQPCYLLQLQAGCQVLHVCMSAGSEVATMLQASKATDGGGEADGSADEADDDDSDERSEISLVSEDDLPAGSVAVENTTKRQRTA